MHRTMLAALAALTVGLCLPAQAQAPFRFLHITDTHVSSPEHQRAVEDLVTKASAMTPKPAFIVNTGDITELGFPEEYAKYTSAIKGSTIPVHNCPGNHDVRWAPLGKQAFTDALGDRYHSFTHEGIHVVLLDSTVLLEHWGHFDPAMLRWLEADLKKQRKGTPIVLAFHAWVGRDAPSIDNEEALFRAIAPYNVVAMLIGHGHSDLQWKVNGINCFMAKGLYQGSYHIVDVDAKNLTVTRVSTEAPNGKVIATIARAGTGRRSVGFAWDDPNIPYLARRRLLAEMRIDDKQISEDKITCAYAIDDGKPTPMPVDTRDKKGLSFIGEFETKDLSDGAHRARILLTAPDGEVLRRDEWFRVERLEGHARSAWDDPFQASDTIQSSPAVADGTVYTSSLDGKVYAVDAKTGKQRWAAATKGGIFSSPVVANGVVYVGSMDHWLYAMDAKSGKAQWRCDTGSPLFASAAVADGIVCIGGNKAIYGVDAATGKEVWKQEAKGFFQSRAVTAGGLFFLGGWGNTFYALDTKTGTPKWTATIGRTKGGRGNISFYYSPAIASPTLGDGKVYVCTNDGVLHAMDQATGTEVWIARAPSGGDGFGYSSPLYADGRIYVGGLGEANRGNCYALDAKTGALIWNCATGADNYDSGPALAGDYVVIGSVAGKLTWIERATGKVKHTYTMDESFSFSTAAWAANVAYMTAMSGRLYAIQTP